MKPKKKGKVSYQDTLKRVLKTRKGRAAASRFSRFWGIKKIPAFQMIDVPGVGKNTPYVGLGKSPAIYIADGPKNRHTKKKKIVRRGILIADARGRRLAILSGRSMRGKRRLKRLGHVYQTDYLPCGAIEKAGSFKSGKWWQHDHSHAGGKWPIAHEDQAGNIWYSKGSYTVGQWLRK